MATKKEQEYIAINTGYGEEFFKGTLKEISEWIVDGEHDFDDFEFHKTNPVKLKFVQQIVLAEETGN